MKSKGFLEVFLYSESAGFLILKVPNVQGTKCAGCVKYLLPRNTMVSLHTKFGVPMCKGIKTRAKSTKELMRRVLNVQGTKFESPNPKGMETRSKSTKIVNVQGLNFQGSKHTKCAGCDNPLHT